MAGLTLENVTKRYGELQVIHGVDLIIEQGEFCVFVGPSGCGKSTLLRMIAGLEDISGGSIAIGGRIVNEVAPAKRGVAMVFQTYALYPHMTVYNNMAFGLRQAKMPKTEIDTRVRAAAEVLHITDYLERTPRALSGGQRQRVAIGRAIVREPEVFLFDEPLSNLDAALRVQTRLEIARLHERLGATMVYVTHDQVEAMTLADKIVVLRDGRIEQVGSPMELYERPRNTFVAQFIGSPKMNFFGAGQLDPSAPEDLRGGGPDRIIGIRAEHLREVAEGEGILSARLELVEQLGEYALAHMIGDDGHEFIAKLEQPPRIPKGARMTFTARPDLIHRFDRASGLRID
ncbi:MAG: sn-glycerol-3-phosphate ABC transporter ATP-binding protein UgpC [Rubellimicrobium sp.]|nr:sn-glycerol-3-phosphate ABC transporter ATP-binding protein UgpC [Rubellimicrobium sp.]